MNNMLDANIIDALEKVTISMCDIEVIFQILIYEGITTKEEINQWRKTIALNEPFYTLFKNIEDLKRMAYTSSNSDDKPSE